MAPNWVSPTENNGAGVPHADLHVALLARTPEQALLAHDLRIITPPLWGGRVLLHIIVSHDMTVDDLTIKQAMADLGWADSRDLDIGPPASITEGYPSGTDE